MTGIPSALYSRLRETLLDCGPFEDNSQLRSVFAHAKLTPWRHSVPQASNSADRVDAAIAFLVEKRRADTQENALVLLLRVLSEQLDPADECYTRLIRLAKELERALKGGLPSGQPPMSDAGTVAEIEELVREDRLAEALTKLSGLEMYRHDATLLTRRLNHIRKQQRQGTVTHDDANAERARIAASILDLISS